MHSTQENQFEGCDVFQRQEVRFGPAKPAAMDDSPQNERASVETIAQYMLPVGLDTIHKPAEAR